jgi:hypothetical protein
VTVKINVEYQLTGILLCNKKGKTVTLCNSIDFQHLYMYEVCICVLIYLFIYLYLKAGSYYIAQLT